MKPGSLRAWVLAARPQTLPVAVAPIAVGCAVASGAGAVRWGAVLAAMFGAIWIQIGTNFANDVFDFEKGTDDATRIGPPRAVQQGLITPRAMKIGMVLAFGLATLAGVELAIACGPVIVVIGVLSIASGVAYTGGPYPLGYNGLGDVFVFAFFGVVATVGTAFVAVGSVPPMAWLASVPVGALATNVLVVNNVRDREGDLRSGKRTLAVRFGRAFGVAEYAVLAGLAYVAVGLSPLAGGGWASLAGLLTIPWAVRCARTLAGARDGATLNALLASSAKLMLATSGLYAIGLAIGSAG